MTGKPETASPLFRSLYQAGTSVQVWLDGEAVSAHTHQTVAALLLGLIDPSRYRSSAVSGEPRAPLCLMGVCFECLVEIDGLANQQACLVRVHDGMHIRRQLATGEVDANA